MCATTVSGRCGRISATLSPRATPSAASAFDSRFACCCRSQNVCARRAPDSSSQYSAKRARSSAQRPQHACAMLKSARDVPAVRRRGSRRSGRRPCARKPTRSRRRGGNRAAVGSRRSASRLRADRAVRPSAQTQSGCCSSRRPKRIGLIDFDGHAACSRLRGLVFDGRHDQRLHGGIGLALAQRRGTGHGSVRPLIVVASPSTE